MRRLSALLLAAALGLSACGDDAAPDVTDTTTVDAETAAVATPTSTVVVDYRGTLEDGSVFDSGERAEFPLQAVVPGFRDAIVGMAEGESKTFDVSLEQGYGAAGAPPMIPPNATLTFTVTVHEVR